MVSTDIYWHFDRPEKLPERERPRSFVPRWESGTIKQYQAISNEPSALDTSCSKTVLSDQVGVMCQQGWSQRVESSLHVVLQSVHVFSCLDLFWKKSNVKHCQTKPIQFVHDAGNLAFAAWSRSERSRQDFARNQMGPICCCVFDHESYMLQHVTAPSFIIFVIWPHRWLHVLLQMRLHLCKQLPRWIVLTLDF